ncbi:MAG: aminotransferase class V-fold PLP-dependent enzyme [Thiothrix litoralis]|uniref:aminotransferase class V-fold PLP-dependent enzyme n=1 Tax=Thiothrix litoralis TaxID=2891210 RepID=UPI003C77CE12
MPHEFQSLAQLFQQQVMLTPGQVALSDASADITYGELNAKANQIAHYLAECGIGSGQLVALYLERSVDWVVALLGVLKAGAAYVPLDSSTPVGRVSTILCDCQPSALITRKILCLDNPLPFPGRIDLDTDWPLISQQPACNPDSAVSVDSLLYVIYTSGLTGHPKAVRGIYQGILNRLHWTWNVYPFQAQEVACHRVSISAVDHLAEIFAPLLKGIPLVILADDEANDPEQLIRVLARKRITRLVVAPSLLKSMLCVRKELIFHLEHLKQVFCSGEALSKALAGLFYQRFKQARLINVYGATETSADASWYEVKRSDVDNVLAYFSKALDFGSEITAANVPVNELAAHFQQTRMAESPTQQASYFDWFHKEVLPYSIDTASPLYVGHMTSALPDFVHDVSKLISQMNQNLVKIETAKSAIFLEREALAMLHRCFYGLDDAFYAKYVQKVNTNLGLVTTGGTISNITALMIARNRALSQLTGRRDWQDQSIYSILAASGYKDLVLLGSKLMHYSMKKSASVLGLGMRNIVHVDFTPDGVLDTADLNRKLEQCKQDGLLVFAMVGIAGATETGHIDPLEQMADIAQAHGIYFHVDAAWGGSALFSEQYRPRFKGLERAQSVTFCAHKQLYLPQGISVCLFRDPEELQYGETTAAYQATPDSYDVGRFSIEGSRSAMALLVHASLQLIGRKGYEALFNASVDKALFFSRIVDAMDCFELLFEPPLNIVNYRYIPQAYRQKLGAGALSPADNRAINVINQQIQEMQFLRGSTFVSKTTLTNTRYGQDCPVVVFRVILANPLTTQADIHQVLEDQLGIAQAVCGDEISPMLGNGENLHGFSLADAFSAIATFKEEPGEPLVPIGKPLPNCQVYILDENRQPVPVGVIGEIYVGGVAVSPGYFHRLDEPHERFVPDPFARQPNATLFRTGDRGKWLDDGNIDYRGRNDDLVKIRGHRVELSEVEATLQEVSGIVHCATSVGDDGQGDKFLVAHLVLDACGDSADQLTTIKRLLSKALPDYMVPREYRILGEMPFTLGGKIDRQALTAPVYPL